MTITQTQADEPLIPAVFEAPRGQPGSFAVLSFIGQMGTGKSTLAARLGARLRETPTFRRNVFVVDLDAMIVAEVDMPIADFFETQGEAAFRVIEKKLLLKVISEAPTDHLTLLATGGGSPCNDNAIAALRGAGPVIWLDASPDVLAARALTPDRPLLRGHDQASATVMLASQRDARMPWYRQADLRLDAALPPGELVERVVARYFPSSMPETAHTPLPPPLDVILAPESIETTSYPIHFVSDLPGEAVARLAAALLPDSRRLLVVTDANVAPLYLHHLVGHLVSVPRFDMIATHIIPAGEASKDLAHLSAICDAALAAGLTRKDALVALGGGVVGDITGFAAAILNRGIPFIQVPTTLLAQVDSAVGGKTAINHTIGKNLIGAFHQPVAVVASQKVLRTLPEREFRCGLAEAIKHAFIADAAFLAWIRDQQTAINRQEPAALAHLVHRCCSIKRDIVIQDPREQGIRAVLNFGHTLGHAYEKLLGYGHLTHGEAVALGMLQAGRLSDALACDSGFFATIRDSLAPFGFDTDIDSPLLPTLDDLIGAAINDKKADAGGSVRFIVLEAIGKAAIRRLTWVDVRRLLGPDRANP